MHTPSSPVNLAWALAMKAAQARMSTSDSFRQMLSSGLTGPCSSTYLYEFHTEPGRSLLGFLILIKCGKAASASVQLSFATGCADDLALKPSKQVATHYPGAIGAGLRGCGRSWLFYPVHDSAVAHKDVAMSLEEHAHPFKHLEIAMYITTRPLVAALLIGSPLLAVAVDEHHPDQAPAGAQSQSASAQGQEKVMAEQVQRMQAIHDRIAAAKTPEERQAAMHDGMQAMKDGLGMMQNGCAGKGMGMHMKMMDPKMMEMMMKMLDQQAGMMSSPSNMKDMPMQRSMEPPAPKPAQ